MPAPASIGPSVGVAQRDGLLEAAGVPVARASDGWPAGSRCCQAIVPRPFSASAASPGRQVGAAGQRPASGSHALSAPSVRADGGLAPAHADARPARGRGRSCRGRAPRRRRCRCRSRPAARTRSRPAGARTRASRRRSPGAARPRRSSSRPRCRSLGESAPPAARPSSDGHAGLLRVLRQPHAHDAARRRPCRPRPRRRSRCRRPRWPGRRRTGAAPGRCRAAASSTVQLVPRQARDAQVAAGLERDVGGAARAHRQRRVARRPGGAAVVDGLGSGPVARPVRPHRRPQRAAVDPHRDRAAVVRRSRSARLRRRRDLADVEPPRLARVARREERDEDVVGRRPRASGRGRGRRRRATVATPPSDTMSALGPSAGWPGK